MTAIWRNDGRGWTLLTPSEFPDEKTLQDRIEEAPQLLPLAGSPHLLMVGREVLLGGKYADLIAVETSGRLVIIEVKLAKNSEARRAVVSQILTYAAYLHGVSLETLEQVILQKDLHIKNASSLADLIKNEVQGEEFNSTAFEETLRTSLANGHFRLVLVLDKAPDELIQLVGYLGSITNEELLIDLITVSAYQVGNETVLVPQRIEPERRHAVVKTPRSPISTVQPKTQSRAIEGEEEFIKAIKNAPSAQQTLLQDLLTWAVGLKEQKIATLYTDITPNFTMLKPRIIGEEVGLVVISLEKNGASLWFYRSVFERKKLSCIQEIETLIAPDKFGNNTITRKITKELLSTLTRAYREASHQTPG
jgi:hypothetical protein